MPSETKVTIPWSIPAAVSVKGIVHVPAHNTPMKPGGRETLLIAIAEQDPRTSAAQPGLRLNHGHPKS
jgi:hypothetical protein